MSNQVSTTIIIKVTNYIEAHCSTRLFSFKQVFTYIFAFCSLFFIMNIITKLIVIVHSNIDIPFFWPISVFTPRIPDISPINSLLPSKLMYLSPQYHLLPPHLLIALCYAVGLFLTIKYLDKIQTPYLVYLVGFCTIFVGNLIQGFYNGFVVPICGGSGIQYYHDAINIIDMLNFIGNYNTIQSELLCHARTHPPGAVLIYYILNSISSNPAFTSIVLMGISLLSVIYIYNLISMFYSQKTARSISLMFIFLPAVQIYFLSTLDSLILLTFTATIYHYYHIKDRISWGHMAMLTGFILISSLLTYLAIFPVALICLDSLANMKLKPLALVLAVCLFTVLAFLLLNFNYIDGFIMSSKLENPSGFRLLSDTASYIVTRIENIGEIALFFGPLSLVLLYRGVNMFLKDHMGRSGTHSLINLSFWGILLLFGLFLTGAARTGETARCCIFIYPLLLVFIAHYLERISLDNKSLQQLILVLGVQSLLMQMFGFYFW